MSKRPSKNYFYSLLKDQLPNTQGRNVLDAASSRFKNRSFFPGANYVGADLDRQILERGLCTHAGDSVYAYCCDLAQDMLPRACFDLAVSTHTFGHLDAAGRRHFLDQLTTALRCGGDLIFNSPKLPRSEWEQLLLCLRRDFEEVSVKRYRNILSQLYEDYLMPKQDLSSRQVQQLPLRVCSRLLQWLEAVSAGFPMGQEAYYVFAHGCRRSAERLEFNPSLYPSMLFLQSTAEAMSS